MPVLVDTSVWSLVLRRSQGNLSSAQQRVRVELTELIQQGVARLIGPIRQELLSGIRDQGQYERLRDHLRAFDEPALIVEDYEEAARMRNLCRSRGVSGSAIDFVMCAAGARRNWPIFTSDKDFVRYARFLPIRIHVPRDRPSPASGA